MPANDSWWLIARKFDMLTEEVVASNPGTTQDTKLQPGQIIKLKKVIPYLTVIGKEAAAKAIAKGSAAGTTRTVNGAAEISRGSSETSIIADHSLPDQGYRFRLI